jgi:hypothetical protein
MAFKPSDAGLWFTPKPVDSGQHFFIPKLGKIDFLKKLRGNQPPSFFREEISPIPYATLVRKWFFGWLRFIITILKSVATSMSIRRPSPQVWVIERVL